MHILTDIFMYVKDIKNQIPTEPLRGSADSIGVLRERPIASPTLAAEWIGI